MAEFQLPPNSRVKSGKTFKASGEAKNVRRFMIYRYDPDSGENPRIDTYEIDMDDCSERLAAHHVAALICSAHGLSIKQWVPGRPAEQYDGICSFSLRPMFLQSTAQVGIF